MTVLADQFVPADAVALGYIALAIGLALFISGCLLGLLAIRTLIDDRRDRRMLKIIRRDEHTADSASRKLYPRSRS